MLLTFYSARLRFWSATYSNFVTASLAEQCLEKCEVHFLIPPAIGGQSQTIHRHRVNHVYNTLSQHSMCYDKVTTDFFGCREPMAEHTIGQGGGIIHGHVDKWDVVVKCS